MTKRDTSRVGKDRTDWRRHRGEAIGGKIERRKATPDEMAHGFEQKEQQNKSL